MSGRLRAQSETIGVVLLLFVVVISVGTAGTFYLGSFDEGGRSADSSVPSAPATEVRGTVTTDAVTLTHNGGRALRMSELDVIVESDGTRHRFAFADGSIDGDGDDVFEPGERWRKDGYAFDGDAVVGVLLVDQQSQSVVYEGERNPSAASTSSTATTTPTATPTPEPTPTNGRPTADAGDDVSVEGREGNSARLDGTKSSDPDGNSLTYEWAITDADGLDGAVRLADRESSRPTVEITEHVVDRDHDVTLELSVSDGSTADTDRLTVTVTEYNRPPNADAGDDRTVGDGERNRRLGRLPASSPSGLPAALAVPRTGGVALRSQVGLDGRPVTLDGSGSTDPDGVEDIASYEWEVVDEGTLSQRVSDAVTVENDPRSAYATLTLANTLSLVETREVRIRLTVTDDSGARDTDEVVVRLLPTTTDTQPPTVDITDVESGGSRDEVSVTYRVSDDYELDSIRVYVGSLHRWLDFWFDVSSLSERVVRDNAHDVQRVDVSDQRASGTVSLDRPPYASDYNYYVVVFADDTSGNTGSESERYANR